MPSQLQWKPGYTGLRACMHAHFWNPPQLISPTQGLCLLGREDIYGCGHRGGLGPVLRQVSVDLMWYLLGEKESAQIHHNIDPTKLGTRL